MKRTTAVRHLFEMGEMASDHLQLRASDIGWPLEEIWVTGGFLDEADEFGVGGVVLVLDVAADELPWSAPHPVGDWVGGQLRLNKRPLSWCCRPSVWPPWNARHRRVACVWSASAGTDEDMIEALRSGAPSAVVSPDVGDFVEQLDAELTSSRAHLRRILGSYWEPDWRREHRGETREDQLWQAANAVTEIEDALDSAGA